MRYRVWQPNTPHPEKKTQKIGKNEKIVGDIIILHRCTKNHNHELRILRYRVRDTFFCHFGPFFALLPHYWPQKLKFGKNFLKNWRYYPFTHVYHKWRSYDVWFLRYEARQTEFFVILGHYFPFDPPNNPKNQNFEKMKRQPGDIIILHLCTTSNNHIKYGFWDMEQDRQNFLSFWTIFCPSLAHLPS